MNYPKISIITPVYNQCKYIEAAILSVLQQSYSNLEYIVIDGGSTDGTVEIIKKYQNRITHWISEPDKGMYFALQKGFERSTGEIIGWLNSDDLLHPNSLFSIAEILKLEGVNWIMGAPSYFDEMGRCVRIYGDEKWSRLKFYTNGHAYMQQESIYWTRQLWEKAGGYISTDYKLAGDFELWSRFFRFEKLYTLHCLVGGYRMLSRGQLTADYGRYTEEADGILEKVILESGEEWRKKIDQLNRLKYLKVLLRKSRIFNIHFITNRIDKKMNRLYGYSPQIEFDRSTQKFKIVKNIYSPESFINKKNEYNG